MKHLFYLMGKSASGKNALYEYLIGDSSLALAPLIPWTTRPIRANEQDGVEYHFTDEDGLRALELSNAIHLSGWTGERVEIPVSREAFNRELDKRIAKSVPRTGGDITYDTDHSRGGSRNN